MKSDTLIRNMQKIIIRSGKRSDKTPKPGFILICAVYFLLIIVQNSRGQNDKHGLYDFLKQNIYISKNELTDLKQGKIFTKLLKTKLRREIAVFGALKINVPKEFAMKRYSDSDIFIETSNVLEAGKFSSPPVPADVQPLTLDPRDIQAIKDCKIGNCDIKMSEQSMQQFRQLIDWSAPDYQHQVQELFHHKIIQYVKSYLAGGTAAMAEFDDQKYRLYLGNEFQDLLKESPYLYVYSPDFHRYLEKYPKEKLANVNNFIYWLKEEIGTKRKVISITHISVYLPEKPEFFDILVASKKIYATHYFEAAFGLSALADNPVETKDSYFLLYLNRFRIDALRHPHFGGIIRRKIRSGLHKLLKKKMLAVKAKIEKMYQDEIFGN